MRFDVGKYIDLARLAETPLEARAHLDVARDHIFSSDVYALVADAYAGRLPKRLDVHNYVFRPKVCARVADAYVELLQDTSAAEQCFQSWQDHILTRIDNESIAQGEQYRILSLWIRHVLRYQQNRERARELFDRLSMVFDAVPRTLYGDVYEDYANLAAACDVDVSSQLQAWFDHTLPECSDLFSSNSSYWEGGMGNIRHYPARVKSIHLPYSDKFKTLIENFNDHFLKAFQSRELTPRQIMDILEDFIYVTGQLGREAMSIRLWNDVVSLMPHDDIDYLLSAIKCFKKLVSITEHSKEFYRENALPIQTVLFSVLEQVRQSSCNSDVRLKGRDSDAVFSQVYFLTIMFSFYGDCERSWFVSEVEPLWTLCLDILLCYPANYFYGVYFYQDFDPKIFSTKQVYLEKLKRTFDDYLDQFLKKPLFADLDQARQDYSSLASAYVKLFDDTDTMARVIKFYLKKTGDQSVYINWTWHLYYSGHVAEANAVATEYLNGFVTNKTSYSFRNLMNLSNIGVKYKDMSIAKAALLLAEKQVNNMLELHALVRFYHRFFSGEPQLVMRLLPVARSYLTLNNISRYHELNCAMAVVEIFTRVSDDEILYDDLMHLECEDKRKQFCLVSRLAQYAWSKKFKILYLQKAERCGVSVVEKIKIATIYKNNLDDTQNVKRILESARELCHSKRQRKRLDKAIRRLL